MVKQKGSEKEKEISDALKFIKSMKESTSFKNPIIKGFLEEKENVLHDELYITVSEKFNDSKED